MKILLILGFFFLNIVAVAQGKKQSTADLMDLVVEIPKLELNKSFDHLKSRLGRIQSMKVEGYCNSSKTLCLRFHPEQYFNVLVAINEAGFAYYIKRNENVNSAINSCSDKKELYLRESSFVQEGAADQ